MTVRTAGDLYYDPWDVDLNSDPYPMFRRIRESIPISAVELRWTRS